MERNLRYVAARVYPAAAEIGAHRVGDNAARQLRAVRGQLCRRAERRHRPVVYDAHAHTGTAQRCKRFGHAAELCKLRLVVDVRILAHGLGLRRLAA